MTYRDYTYQRKYVINLDLHGTRVARSFWLCAPGAMQYHIAGNFRGGKFSRFSRFFFHRENKTRESWEIYCIGLLSGLVCEIAETLDSRKFSTAKITHYTVVAFMFYPFT